MSAPDTPRCSPTTRARVSSSGRWSGRVCRRDFPLADEVVDLAPATRRRLAEVWIGQAATESRVADSFVAVRGALSRLGADRGLVALAGRAVDDEHRHAALCEEMAGRYGGCVAAPHVPLAHQRPEHPSAASALIRDALWVIGQCALNETLATAYLSAARSGAKAPLAKHAIRELMEDEIDHARIGWAFLTELEEADKRPLDEWLLPLTICNLREWSRLELPDDDSLAAHGVPPYELAREAVRDAVEGVLLPGFGHAGFDTRALERWVADGAELPRAA